MKRAYRALFWIGGVLAAVFVGGFLVDRRHTYRARLEQLREKRERLNSEGEVIGRAILAVEHRAEEKQSEIQTLEKKRAAIHARAAKLKKSEVSYEQALARLGHDPADWDRLGLGV